MTDSIRPLAEGFEAIDDAQWRVMAEAALKGAPLERLVRKTLDGVARGPLFTRTDRDAIGPLPAPGAAPYLRGLTAERDPYLPWGVRQIIDDADPKAANAALLSELSGGVSEIALTLDPTGAMGVAVRTLDELKTVLDGVMLDLAPVYLQPSRMAPQYAALALAYIRDQGLDLSTLKGGLGLSPIGQKSLAGGGAENLPERLKRTAEAAAWCADHAPNIKVVSITANAPHEAGGSAAQELAFACGGGASYMRAFIDHGLTPDQAANALEFSFAADADVHLTIAKLRAARRVWARVAEAFGCSPEAQGMRICAITSSRMLTARDAWTNLIRNACAGLGAAAGGADSITVRPFNEPLGAATSFARRVGRNLQIMLMEESHLGVTADPAGGSYLHETLGHRLAQAGWDLFQQIERRGGLFETVKAGWLQNEVAKTRDAYVAQYAEGRESLIGVTQYANLEERPVEAGQRSYTPPKLDAPTLEPQPFADKLEAAANGHAIRLLEAPDQNWPPLRYMRMAEPFEALRDAADAHAEKTGQAPRAFLATLGALADFNARASFASNRLAVSGVETDQAREYADIDACADAFAETGSKLAVICGTDDAYSDMAEELAEALKQAGAQEIWVAGKPGSIPGVDHFIHMRSHSLEDGERAHTILGVSS
ncbi:MAG: hypothetical protein CMH90_05440 [Oceanicaulis sp.]|uniref:methylmalonyl-CoA mutase family protein n=1 Tax=Oceanicaulis sp. UBA2681 TaxID=1947007 RepID=UPI000C0AD583|nr:methylmalonyl-CoA mutase family protein [Oceanicaulis sp. UBA2681]MAP48908.1 hypothetical protein [Oceanicaulis sp.]